MPFNGSGTYSRDNGTYTGSTVWAQDNANGYKIVDTRHDTHDQDIATALSSCLVKDGQQSPTANLPMAGFKHTNVAVASARTDYARYSQVQDSSPVYAAGGGTATAYTLTLSPAVTAYAAGQRFFFFANAANSSGAVTLNVNGVGAIGIKKNNGTANGTDPEAFAIQQYDLVEVVYNGTVFMLAAQAEHIRPATTNTFDLGSATAGWARLWTNEILATTSNVVIKTNNSDTLWTFDTGTGDLTQNGTNGGSITISKDYKSFSNSVATGLSAAGSSASDATVITKAINTISTATVGQGVKLSNSWPTGSVIYLKNTSLANVIVYADTGATIDASASFTLITPSAMVVTKGSSTQWYIMAEYN